MMEHGLVEDVVYATFGAYLSADQPVGATEIVVTDSADFNEGGGNLQITSLDTDGVTLRTDEYQYTAVDFDADTITLASGLLVAGSTGDRLDLVPVTVEKRATVQLSGANEDTITARVPLSFFDRLAEGVRNDDSREAVAVELQGSEWVITDILGVVPVIDGSYIDQSTLPQQGPDGVAPAVSPTPTVIGGLGALFVKWTPIDNHDPVTYEVHLGTASGFTTSSSTLAAETMGGSATLRTLPDNTTALSYGTTYFVKIIAKDADGAAPVSAETSGSMHQIASADILGQAVDVSKLADGSVSAAKLVAGAVDTTKLADGAVSAAKLVAGSVDTTKLADSAVSAAKLATGAVDTTKINFTARDIGGSTATYSSTAPAMPKTGDLWFNTGNKNEPKVWSGSAWTSVRDTTIADAQTTANGKNKIYYQDSMPTGGTYITGDTWYDTNDGYKMYVYNGSTFAVSLLGSTAVGFTARDIGAQATYRQPTAPTNPKQGETWVKTAANGSLYFNGTTDYVSIPNTGGILAPSQQVTWEIRFKVDATPDAYDELMGFGPNAWDMRMDSGTSMTMHWYDAPGNWAPAQSFSLTSPSTFYDGQWHTLAGVWDGVNGVRHVRVDGVTVTSGTFTAGSTAQDHTADANFFIGAVSGPTRFFNGWIDEVRVWNVIRSDADLDSTAALTGSETGLVGLWKMGDANNGVLPDHGPNGLNGTINGAVWSSDSLADPVVYDEIYSYDGSTWQPVTVPDNTITASKIAAGAIGADQIAANAIVAGKIAADAISSREIASDYVYAGNITATQITGATVSADGLLAGSIKTANGGARVELGPTGLQVYKADGTPTTVLGSDGTSTFKGDVEANTLTATGAVSMRSPSNELAGGAALTLASGVQPPVSAPTYVVGHDTTTLNVPTTGAQGFTYYNGKFYTIEIVAGGAGAFNVCRYGTDGTYETAVSTGNSTQGSAASITNLGGYLYVLTSKGYIVKIDPATMSYVSTVPLSGIAWTTLLSIGSDGTNLLVTRLTPVPQEYHVDTFTTAGTWQSSVNLPPPGSYSVSDMGVMVYDNVNFSGPRYVVAATPVSGPSLLAPYSTTGVHQQADDWNSISNPVGALALGPSNKINQLNDGRTVTVYEAADTATTPWWIGYTWYDSNATGGTHETTISPLAGPITVPKRAKVTMTSAAIPNNGGTDDPNSVRFYVGRGSSAPANAALWRQNIGADLAPGVTSTSIAIPDAGQTGTNPPSTNGFLTGTSGVGQIKSGSGNLVAKGDGSGTWGSFDHSTGGTSNLSRTVTIANSSSVGIDAGSGNFVVYGDSHGTWGPFTFANSGTATVSTMPVTGEGANSWFYTCSTAANPTTTTVVTTPGLSHSFTCPGTSAVYLVEVSLDVQQLSTTAVFVGMLYVDGTAQSAQMIYQANAAAFRSTLTKTYRITGLSAGSHTFDVRSNLTGSGSYRINSQHSTMLVQRNV